MGKGAKQTFLQRRSMNAIITENVKCWAQLSICPREMKTLCPHKSLYRNVHSNIIHNNQKVETTKWPSTDEKINKTKCGVSLQWNIVQP